MRFPTLFKKTSTGAIQFWSIGVTAYDGHGIIDTSYGQLDTDSPQITSDIISKGKNIGKKNETTPEQQAEAEAQAKWQKQKKRGYVETIEAAQAGELDALIEGGIAPMLAHKYSDHAHKVKFPAHVQPKLDGIRCIAILKDGKCTLWSRTRKPITSMPHIVAEIEAMEVEGDLILDGELYNQKFKTNFEHIVHLVRQEDPDPQHTDVEYHIYDSVDTKADFETRWRWLTTSWRLLNIKKPPKYLKLVDTAEANDESDVTKYFKVFKGFGYEGAILRNSKGMYVNKRSYDLQKVKEFEDDEFKIVGIEEGRGKLAGHVGAFVCSTKDGKEFLAKMSGETTKLKEYFENHKFWEGKTLTVQYQGLTSYGIPRFPVGMRLRDAL
jgi:DNA ligase-1